MARFYVEHVSHDREAAWEIMEVGEGRKATCFDITFAFRVVDFLNATTSAAPSAAGSAAASASGSAAA